MGKPIVGEVVVIPFPQTDLARGKRRPALVLADLPGDDLILCQITSRQRSDGLSIPLDASDFERGQLRQQSFIRPQRLFTVETAVILYSVGKVSRSKLDEVLAQARKLLGRIENETFAGTFAAQRGETTVLIPPHSPFRSPRSLRLQLRA